MQSQPPEFMPPPRPQDGAPPTTPVAAPPYAPAAPPYEPQQPPVAPPFVPDPMLAGPPEGGVEPFAPPSEAWRRVSPKLTTVKRISSSIWSFIVFVPAALILWFVVPPEEPVRWAGPAWLALGVAWWVWRWFRAKRLVASYGWARRDKDLCIVGGLWFRNLEVVPFGRMQVVIARRIEIMQGAELVIQGIDERHFTFQWNASQPGPPPIPDQGQQFGLGPHDQVSQRDEVKPFEALAGPARKLDLREHAVEDLRGSVGERPSGLRRSRRSRGFLLHLPKLQPLLGQHGLDFLQRSLAEVLVGHQLRLADSQQIAQGVNVHLLQAVPRANAELEVGDRGIHDRASLDAGTLLVLVVEHVHRALNVLEEHPGSRVVRVLRQNTIHTIQCFFMATVVLVDGSQIQQHVDVRWHLAGKRLVQRQSFGLLAVQIELIR